MITDTTSRLVLTSPPATEPLTLSEAKTFLRIEHDADDAAIARAITAARQAAESHLRLLLIHQSYTYTTAACGMLMPLPVGPGQTIASLHVIDAQGNATELDSDAYRLSMDGFGVVFHNPPQAPMLEVAFTAGLAADASGVAVLLRQGMLHHVAVMLEHRDGAAAMPVQALQCYQPYRRVRL